MVTNQVFFDSGTHTYRDQSGSTFPSVTSILKRAGLINHFGNATEEQANRGTSIHWMTSLEDQGALNVRRLSRPMRLYRKAYVSWKKASGFVPVEIEQPFISSFGYAGTIDRIGYFDADNRAKTAAVVDLKTGSVIPASVNLQLVGYARARFTHPCRRIALRLLPDGTYRVREYPIEDFNRDLAEFISLVRRYGA